MLYADDGQSMAFQHGGYLRQTLRCAVAPDGGLMLSFDRREGSYKPWWREIAVTVHGWQGGARIDAGGKSIAATSDAAARTVTFTVPDSAAAMRIGVAHD